MIGIALIFLLLTWYRYQQYNLLDFKVWRESLQKILSAILSIPLFAGIMWVYYKTTKAPRKPYVILNSYYVLMVVNIFGILLMISKESPAQTGWSKEEESKIRVKFLERPEIKMLIANDQVRYVDCAIEKFKKTYPNGLRGLSEKEGYETGKRVGEECKKELGTLTMRWSKEFEEYLINDFDKNMKELIPDYKERITVAYCYVQKLKSKYPDGVTEENIFTSAESNVSECMLERSE